MWIELFPKLDLPISGEHLWVIRDGHKYRVRDTTLEQIGGVIPFISFDPPDDKITLWGTLSNGQIKIVIENSAGTILHSALSLLSLTHSTIDPLVTCRVNKLSAQERGLIKIYLRSTSASSQVVLEHLRIYVPVKCGGEN